MTLVTICSVFSWHYWKYLNQPATNVSKSGVMLLLQESAYYASLHLWLRHIKRESLLVVQLENMKRNLSAVANTTYDFLGLSPLPASALRRIATAQPPFYQKFLHANATIGSSRKGLSDAKDPYMKYETKRMLCELQRPFNITLVNPLPEEHFEWANSTYC